MLSLLLQRRRANSSKSKCSHNSEMSAVATNGVSSLCCNEPTDHRRTNNDRWKFCEEVAAMLADKLPLRALSLLPSLSLLHNFDKDKTMKKTWLFPLDRFFVHDLCFSLKFEFGWRASLVEFVVAQLPIPWRFVVSWGSWTIGTQARFIFSEGNLFYLLYFFACPAHFQLQSSTEKIFAPLFCFDRFPREDFFAGVASVQADAHLLNVEEKERCLSLLDETKNNAILFFILQLTRRTDE